MRIERGKLYAVVTGDVVASSRLSPKQRRDMRQILKNGSACIRAAFPKAFPLDVGIFRGDAWQMLVTDPVRAFRVALYYRVWLRAQMRTRRFDTRMAVAVGTVDFVPGQRVSEGDGDAYRQSGAALEAMPGWTRMRLVTPGADTGAVDVVVSLLDVLIARWSGRQALAVVGALQGLTQAEIAKTLWREPITQQAVAQHLERAGWAAVERAIRLIDQHLGGYVERATRNA